MGRNIEINPIRLELRYKLEEDFAQAVCAGNRKRVNELLEYRQRIFPDPDCSLSDSASDKLRLCKNRLQSFETVCRLAARQAKVPVLALYTLSQKHQTMIEEATSVQYLYDKLFEQIVCAYTDLVLSLSISAYTPLIQQLVVYICSHIGDELSLDILGAVHHVNQAHLSRQFKRETGMTINHYINMQRIALAKMYLEHGKAELGAISEMLGFQSTDYFSKVFKRETGVTPTKYMKSVRMRRCVD
ncbi:MAG: AraC family transcriptional regulator [Sphaerochaetaceae bacterium]|jgi:AraC-like DNA-binding protein|nr:AraC family transcriptional regulator [Sphaerochaetaceae bacterium]MDX9808813.1 AraC family transcriptional regulator [Sphaerochaetaceae bacterium]NLV83398.1 helix-turn-helix transcriptional regulator [Spirochaetales bacterium]